jgi:hypothetical protein
MFIVKALKVGPCLACGKQVECVQIESTDQRLAGLLCLQDFRKQVKIAMAAEEARRPRPPQSTAQ